MKSLARLAVLSQELSLKNSPVVATCLSWSPHAQTNAQPNGKQSAQGNSNGQIKGHSNKGMQGGMERHSKAPSDRQKGVYRGEQKILLEGACADDCNQEDHGWRSSLFNQDPSTLPADTPDVAHSTNGQAPVISKTTSRAMTSAAASTPAYAAAEPATTWYAQSLVVEAVKAAAQMVDAFPHVHEDLAELLASRLRLATGEFCISRQCC